MLGLGTWNITLYRNINELVRFYSLICLFLRPEEALVCSFDGPKAEISKISLRNEVKMLEIT